MKFERKSWLVAGTLLLLLLAIPLIAANKKTASDSKVIDEGTFTIAINGAPVATESFTIRQNPEGSVSKSEVKKDGKALQSCEMTMAANGNLVKYEWNELQAPKGKNVVEPSNDFLVEHYGRPDGKTGDQPFLMPASSPILEDFVFSHRELLLWRYLGSSCSKGANGKCEFAKTQYGVVIPRQRLSSMVTVEFTGVEKVDVKGTQKELSKFRIGTEGPDWFAWIDENYKVQKIAIPDEGTVVTRD